MVTTDSMSDIRLTLVECVRVRSGKLATEKVLAGYHKTTRALTIWSDWSSNRQMWTVIRSYIVNETETDFKGRAFRLERGGDLVAEENDECYDVFIAAPGSEDHNTCDCRGSLVCPECKHTGVLRQLIHEGQL